MGTITATVISNLVKSDKFGVDDQGRTTATRNFLVRITPSTTGLLTHPTKMASVLNASGVPKTGDRLFDSAVPSGMTNPYVNGIDVSPERDDDPFTYLVAVTYGYKENNQATQDDDTGDEPDLDRERYPWEQNAEVNLDFGSSREMVPEVAEYAGCLSLAEVEAERGKAGAITFDTVTQPLKNTAGDGFKDPPTKTIRSGNITINFNVLTNDTFWSADDFGESMFRVNLFDYDIVIDGASLFTVPAGCSQLVGFKVDNSTYVESKKWRPGKRHPFEKTDSTGRVMRNTTKTELTGYRYWTYKKITITIEYREDGYIHYIENLGFRERILTPNFRNIAASKYTLQAIKDTTTRKDITEPWKLNEDGRAMDFESPVERVFFQKYIYYKHSMFPWINNIPWQWRGTTPNA